MTTAQIVPPQRVREKPGGDALDITVLAGGPSIEREVSLNSGRAVLAALQRLGHRAVLADISPDDLTALDRPADLVFIALHGEFGEDGTVQAELERRSMNYVGSGVEASKLAMDKVAAKRRFEAEGIPTPEYEFVDRDTVGDLSSRFAAPAIVKPVSSGSSVDTAIARNADDLSRIAWSLVEKHGCALVERYVVGPELTVGILGDEALPVCEIRTQRAFYDYQAKYNDDDTRYLFDLDLPVELIERVRSLALRTHRLLGCRVFSRVDFMVDDQTLEPTVLEVNTIPGFTSHSLLPKAAARIGLSFDDVCQRIVQMSLAPCRSTSA